MTDPFGEQWFSRQSQAALVELFGIVSELKGDVVEVGSWTGRSTVALANACRPDILQAVDTWEGSPGEISSELAKDRDVYRQFCDNVEAFTCGNVDIHRMGWRDYFALVQNPIRFLFIDAEHTYVEVRDNIEAALPLLVPGAVICGDDVHHPPIQQAVLDTLGNAHVAASLWWCQL